MEYVIILAVVLLVSPFVIRIAGSQKKEVKNKTRLVFLSLLFLQIISGFLNWETFKGPGRSGFELVLTYPNSYLGMFFILSLVQLILLIFKQSSLDTLSVVLNFVNTIVIFAGMILLSAILGFQAVSLASVGAVFSVLIGNIVALAFINKDKNILKKYPFLG